MHRLSWLRRRFRHYFQYKLKLSQLRLNQSEWERQRGDYSSSFDESSHHITHRSWSFRLIWWDLIKSQRECWNIGNEIAFGIHGEVFGWWLVVREQIWQIYLNSTREKKGIYSETHLFIEPFSIRDNICCTDPEMSFFNKTIPLFSGPTSFAYVKKTGRNF